MSLNLAQLKTRSESELPPLERTKQEEQGACGGGGVDKNVVCLPADTVESNQAEQIGKADPGTLQRKGCEWQRIRS